MIDSSRTALSAPDISTDRRREVLGGEWIKWEKLFLCRSDRLPFESSPSIPLHFVEREGPSLKVIGPSAGPPSPPGEGPRVRPRRAGRPSLQYALKILQPAPTHSRITP